MNEIQVFTPEEIEEIKEAMIKFMEVVQKFFEKVREAWDKFVIAFHQINTPMLVKIREGYLRLWLWIKLLHWHIPNWIAFRIAKYIPRRLLFKMEM